ncbi:MAG: DnaJ domain-containing protein [Phycisphaerales bacterium]|nr:MAG: DnaJ domain-containing protein [Phycisphaerales bacterium]
MAVTDVIPWRRRKNNIQVRQEQDLDDWLGSFNREMHNLMGRFFRGFDMAKNYYAILGISPTASVDDVKAAYRRLAKEFHPGHYSGDLRTFLDVQEAYSVLGDENRRREYDERFSGGVRPVYRGSGKQAAAEPQAEPLIPEEGPAHLDDISLVRFRHLRRPSMTSSRGFGAIFAIGLGPKQRGLGV